jgi:hypothetical protein
MFYWIEFVAAFLTLFATHLYYQKRLVKLELSSLEKESKAFADGYDKGWKDGVKYGRQDEGAKLMRKFKETELS